MSLELLPNELLHDVFKHLSTADLLHAFHGCNRKFDTLLFKDLQHQKHIDLHSTSKCNFDFFWTQYLPQLVHEIISFSFSNDNNTPNQIEQFYAYGFTLSQFTRLQSLSLSHIHSNTTMDRIMIDLPHLSALTHLTFEKCYLEYDQEDRRNLINIIWSLPNLVYCRLDIFFGSTFAFYTPTVTSSTIKYVHGFRDGRHINEVGHLFKHTPCIQCLSIQITDDPPLTDPLTSINSLTKLNLVCNSVVYSSLLNFLRQMPNLSHLKLDVLCYYIDARIWEGLVQKYLTKLKTLQFKMRYDVNVVENNREQKIDQILDSFRNPFWLVEHRWFVQCDWNLVSKNCYVYTLPYAFENFNIDFPICSKSTCAPDDHRWSYDCVRSLTYTSASYLYECLTQSHIQFFNIEHITIELPTGNNFRCKSKQHDQLTSSTASLTDDYETNCLKELIVLLDRCSNVTSLHISEWPLAILKLSKYKNKNVSISELNLRHHTMNKYYYNEEQCDELSHSIFGIQCKILTIDVKKPRCICNLIIKMPNLRVLNARCQNLGPFRLEDLMEWLQKNSQNISTPIKSVTSRTIKDEKYLLIERL